MRDPEIRLAAKASLLAQALQDSDAMVIDELGLKHGAGRIDIALINGELHGYELKSDQDTLQRLPRQIPIYGSVLDRVSLITTSSHIALAEALVPHWWEIILAEPSDSCIRFRVVRLGSCNENVVAQDVVKLLWRDEALTVLRELGAVDGMKSKPRKLIYKRICELADIHSIRFQVRKALKARTSWRSAEPSL